MADYNIPIAGGAGIGNENGPPGQQFQDRPTEEDGNEVFFNIARLRRQYYDYLGVKQAEYEEAKDARRYYHGAQWTEKEIRTLKRRRQPVVVSNRIVRKIDAVTGLVERLKQDPKAYPRNPNGQQGADVATATLRYALDHVDWKSKAPRVARLAAIDGMCGVELDIQTGDHGDPDIDLHIVYADTFFYDPRSIDDNFTDCRYMGVSKWIDLNQAQEMFPDRAEELTGLVESGTDLMVWSDREYTWVNTSAKKVRLVDHWYISQAKWMWAVYIGNVMLMQGVSPYIDERNRTFNKFVMFSCGVDHEADRYGFVRNMKGPQDEINHRRSKALHILNSRRVISEKGAVDDVEKARLEWAKPDGWIETNPNKKMLPDNPQIDFSGQLQMLQEAKNEIENFGPNPALIGAGLENASGRAISLLQQAGVAELGPYIVSYRTFKIRVYRAIWNIVQRFWTAERWIRVTDDEGLAQFVKLNGLALDQYGHPAIVNAVGALDVDIILDEGPDNVNMMGDAYDTLVALAQQGQRIPPEILIELAPLQASVKQRLLNKLQQAQQPDPMKVQAQQIALRGEQAKTAETQSRTVKNYANAARDFHQAHIDSRAQQLDELMAVNDANGPQTGIPAPGPSVPPPAPGSPQLAIPPMPPTSSVDVPPMAAPGPPPAAAPPAPAQPPVMLNLDANQAMSAAMSPLTDNVQRNTDAIAGAVNSMAQAAQAMGAVSSSLHEMAASVHDAARAMAADTELLRDPKTGRAVGSRKVARR